jgi:hypothetical protein
MAQSCGGRGQVSSSISPCHLKTPSLTSDPKIANSSRPALFKKTALARNLVATKKAAKIVKAILVAITADPREAESEVISTRLRV